MNRFHITEIAVSGDNVVYSSVKFKDGVNIVFGPSNTGKSFLIKCIDFMFGGQNIPFTAAGTGYDTVMMRMESAEDYSIQMERKILEGESGEKADNTVHVISNVEGIASDDYTVGDSLYSDVILKLIGIDNRTKIITDSNYTAKNFTIRTVFHLFYLDENNIISDHTTLDSPAYRKINASLMGLLFLLTGDNYQNIIPDNTKAEVERRNTQKSGVILYLNEKIAKLSEEKGVLEEKIATNHDNDIENKLDETISAIENVENEIASASAESRSILERVYDMSARLEEARFLNDRYILLQSQYDSDIQRLEFILDGEEKLSDYEPLTKCPFCDSDIKNPFARISYVSAATAEINKIKLQEQDLEDAASDIQNEIRNLEDEINGLNQRNDIIVGQISSQLTPLASNLREQVKSYKEIVEAKRRIYSLEAMTAELNTDAYNAEETEDEKVEHFSAKDFFDKNLWEYISNNFGKAVKACAYPNFTTARMNIKTADAVVNGKPKKSEGKGYRAFLNTLVLFNMMKVLEEKAKYSLRMLVLDSPILSLKEKDMKESEKTTQGMKESLFKYIIKNCGENQMIIVENELPDGVDYSNANLIEFTMDDVVGRYGFMHTLIAKETL